jgi:hypothetical protein
MYGEEKYPNAAGNSETPNDQSTLATGQLSTRVRLPDAPMYEQPMAEDEPSQPQAAKKTTLRIIVKPRADNGKRKLAESAIESSEDDDGYHEDSDLEPRVAKKPQPGASRRKSRRAAQPQGETKSIGIGFQPDLGIGRCRCFKGKLKRCPCTRWPQVSQWEPLPDPAAKATVSRRKPVRIQAAPRQPDGSVSGASNAHLVVPLVTPPAIQAPEDDSDVAHGEVAADGPRDETIGKSKASPVQLVSEPGIHDDAGDNPGSLEEHKSLFDSPTALAGSPSEHSTRPNTPERYEQEFGRVITLSEVMVQHHSFIAAPESEVDAVENEGPERTGAEEGEVYEGRG